MNESKNTPIIKVRTSSLYGIFAKDIPEKPTITFGPRGNNSIWSYNGHPGFDLSVGAELANQLLFTMCRDKTLVNAIREVSRKHPIFNVNEGKISTVNERNVSIVAHHICHFIDPSILCIVPVQIMVLFMTYYFGYTDNLKAYVHYDFRKYINYNEEIPHPFVATEDRTDTHPYFLNDRAMSFRSSDLPISGYKYLYSHEYIGSQISKLQNEGWYDFIYVHPFTLLVNIVTGCCNYYYFNYGWDYTKPSIELLLSYYMEESDMSNSINYVENKKIWEAKEKLGLNHKDSKESQKHEPISSEIRFMHSIPLIGHMEEMLQKPRPGYLETAPLFSSFDILVTSTESLYERMLSGRTIFKNPSKNSNHFFMRDLYSVHMRPIEDPYNIQGFHAGYYSRIGYMHSGFDYTFLLNSFRAETNPVQDMMITYLKDRRKGRGLEHAITWP